MRVDASGPQSSPRNTRAQSGIYALCPLRTADFDASRSQAVARSSCGGWGGSPSASSSREIRKASRAEYVMRPLEFLVAYRGRHWLTDLIRPTAMVSDHWPKLYGAGDPIDWLP
jgi:hypothetical protein